MILGNYFSFAAYFLSYIVFTEIKISMAIIITVDTLIEWKQLRNNSPNLGVEVRYHDYLTSIPKFIKL